MCRLKALPMYVVQFSYELDNITDHQSILLESRSDNPCQEELHKSICDNYFKGNATTEVTESLAVINVEPYKEKRKSLLSLVKLF